MKQTLLNIGELGLLAITLALAVFALGYGYVSAADYHWVLKRWARSRQAPRLSPF